MTRMRGSDALVRSVIRHGVDTFFILPGGPYELFDALHDYRDSGAIRIFNARHEQGAGYMAFGYTRASGKTGAYAVVPGPGVLNTTAALCTAYAANAPVLCITGEIPTHLIGRGAGFLHEIPDQLGVLERLTKWSGHIGHAGEAPQRVNEAFRQLRSGRPRPVALQIPMDIAAMESEVSLLDPFTEGQPAQPDPDSIVRAANILAKAKRPLIMVGGGAVDAGPELLELAGMLQAPVISHRQGKGIIDDRHYLSHTYPAGHRLWADADAVLAVGTRLKYPLMYWGLDDGIQIVRIDIDPTEISRVARPAVGIVADAKAALAELIYSLQSRNARRASRKQELLDFKDSMRKEYEQAVQPQLAILDVIRQELPEDGFFVDEITQVGYVSWFGFPMYQPRHFISSGYQGNLGYGYAAALGVQAAHPDKKVVSISGDGGFMYQATELATAVRHNLNVTVIVFSDGAFGNVKRDQLSRYEGRLVGSEFTNPDFVQLADSFGIAGYRANSPGQLQSALREALRLSGPALIEMPVQDLPSPWPFIAMPRARP